MNAEYNKRQYNLMLDTLGAYRAGELSLANTIAKLKGLLRAIECPPAQLQDLFECWGVLEQAYARMLDLGLKQPAPDFQSGIDGAIDKMTTLLQQRQARTS